jgi:proteasome accessory factor B
MARKTWLRQERVLDALENLRFGLTATDLAEQFGMNIRTVQRDLKFLFEEGWIEPFDEPTGKRRWRLTEAAKNRQPIASDPTGLFAMRLGLQAAASAVAGTELEGALHEMVRRLETALPPRYCKMAVGIEAVFPSRTTHGRIAQPPLEVIEDIVQAAVERRAIKARYRPAWLGGKKVKAHTLRPLALLPHRGAIYLLATVPHRDNILRFAIHRFVDVELTDEHFARPAEPFVGPEIENAFGIYDGEQVRYRVRFDAALADRIRERIWHDSQKVADLPDGRVELSFTATGWPEIRSWILSWGDCAELVEPAERRRELKEELRRTVKRYS